MYNQEAESGRWLHGHSWLERGIPGSARADLTE